MTDPGVTDLGYLEWNYPIVCSGHRCEHEGVALVRFRVHEDCKAHSLWYVACQSHLDEATSYRVLCKKCRRHLALLNHVPL